MNWELRHLPELRKLAKIPQYEILLHGPREVILSLTPAAALIFAGEESSNEHEDD